VKHTRIVVTRYGGPDALQVIEEEYPEPKQGEVRVKVLAAASPCPTSWRARAFIPKRRRCPTRRGGIWWARWIGGKGGVIGKIVLVRDEASPESGER
jgi:hypothetical protein